MKRIITLILLLTGCASHTPLAGQQRALLDSQHRGHTVELRVSCYYGALYEENELWMLSPYPFADTYHIVDLKNVPIHPQDERGIIPAGTRFIVKKIEFPDRWTFAQRMIMTPRYNIWVYLVPEQDPSAKPYVLILPADLNSEEQVNAAIKKFLSPPGEFSAWLASRSPLAKAAIAHKNPSIGITQDDLLVAMGDAMQWFTEDSTHIAWYPSVEIWLQNGVVIEQRAARKLAPH